MVVEEDRGPLDELGLAMLAIRLVAAEDAVVDVGFRVDGALANGRVVADVPLTDETDLGFPALAAPMRNAVVVAVAVALLVDDVVDRVLVVIGSRLGDTLLSFRP